VNAGHKGEARREEGGRRLHTRQGGEDGRSLKHELTGNDGAVTSLLNLKRKKKHLKSSSNPLN
jgi:hypothetical protein